MEILTAEDTMPEWLIPELALQGALVALAGEPGAGKSFLSYTISLAVAAGVEALGGIVPRGEPRRVVYFDEENSKGDRDEYLRRAWKGLKGKDGKLPDLALLRANFWPVHFELGNKDWEENAAEWVDQVQPHLLVFDTATPCFAIEDENDNAEATTAIKGVQRLMKRVDPVATAIVLKHARIRVDATRRTMRGAKAWQSAVDNVLFQVKGKGKPKRDGLSLTRLLPDKVRAYGLQRPIYISPRYVDEARTGLVLDGSYMPNRDHAEAEEEDEKE